MALVKYNNRSILNVTALGSLSSGDMNLITTNTISSGVASSTFTSNIDSTYDTYMFKFINIHPATNNVNFEVNFRDGGSNFDATKTTTSFLAYHNESGSATTLEYRNGSDLAQSTSNQSIGEDVGNHDDASVNGELFLFSPANTTHVKHFISRSSLMEQDSTPYAFQCYNAGYCNVTAAIDGVSFSFSSGNIDSGVIKMYGLSKS
tara:strand:- start:10 stop:624 length:615 start_codon:yes stop_codon:yes gene_type:complete